MRSVKISILSLAVALGLSALASGQAATAPAELPQNQVSASPATVRTPAGSFDQVVDRIVERERSFTSEMRHLHPLAETYIQNMRPDRELGAVPASDQYFLGRLDLSNGVDDRSFMGVPGFGRRILGSLTSLYEMRFLPLGFAQMVILDDDFQKLHYDFTFVRREFLGEVRCLVIDVEPRKHSGDGRFIGRIWVEDQEYNIVRFNGTYLNPPRNAYYLHFDSWRLNLRPGLWLPAFIYSEESDPRYKMTQTLRFKAQTRFWGYDLAHLGRTEEFTQILVDAPQAVRDQSESGQDATPIESERMWERQAEDNALERLLKIGLTAPEGEVDTVLQTVVNNLMVTNDIEIQPEVRCRVLLTSPLESFTIGHTIVVSRGLLDVLPDEASLAMILAHELSHIVLGHRLDTKLAFNDRFFFADEKTFQRLDFTRRPADEEAADKKAMELLANSPYKDKLGNAGLFLQALETRAPDLKNLIRPHLGNRLADGKSLRMPALLEASPKLEVRLTTQMAALPLGGRIKLDPWSNKVELQKTKPVALNSPREKMPFEVTPFFPYVSRLSTAPDKVALTSPAKEADR
jgi:hypothetical protein